MFHRFAFLAATTIVVATLLTPSVTWACPFCSAVAQTFTEEMNTVQVAVIAKLVEPPKARPADADPLGPVADVAKTKFEIVQVIKGPESLAKTKQIEVLYFGQQPKDTKFLILGVEPPNISWNAPVPLTERAVAYVTTLPKVPAQGADRLAFFQEYLEDSDELLARDSYDEFAKAPYSEIKELKPRLKRDKLLTWIKDSNVLASRRRLYLTLLGVCGTADDVAVLEELITREEPAGQPKSALDALLACYLTLKGPEGMKLVEERFLKDEKTEYTDTYSAIMALRFHGQEENIIPKERLVEGLRHMLDRPQMADLVIPDLARWQDWGSMDKLVKLFKEADEKSSWVRVPVVQFLKACPLPKAQEQIAELEKIDPEAVKRASFFVPLGSGAVAAQTPALVPAPVDGSGAKPLTAETADAALVPPPTISTQDLNAEVRTSTPIAAASSPPAKPAASAKQAAEESANSWWLVFVPLGVGLALLVLLITIVRGGAGQAAPEPKT
jgi:hypothetical protein